MDLQPNVRASYSKVRCLSTNKPSFTLQTRAALHSCVRFSREERWIGPLQCGVRIDQLFLRSGCLFNISRRCSSTPLEERRRVSNYCLSVKEGVRRLIMPSHFALSPLRRDGQTIPLNFIRSDCYSPISPVVTRKDH